jgi:hypothetical protein
MGFGEYNGTLENAQKRIGELVGCRRLLPGALSRNRLEHARNGFLYSGIRIGKLKREGTQQASSTPNLWRALLQMLKKGKCLFNWIRNSNVGSARERLRASSKRPIQNRET